MNDSTNILEMQSVTKSFETDSGQVEVLCHVDLTVFKGEFIAISGPSGSGKTTLLHLAALLDHPTSGRVLFDGEDVSAIDESYLCQIRKKKVGVVFQKYYLLPYRTAYENVLFRFRYLDQDMIHAKQCTDQALETLGLTDIADRPARLLSGGEMQRVAIARAIAFGPKLLIADEPTGNLDRVSVTEVMDCFRTLNQAGITVLMTTHNENLLKYCTRHISLKEGCIQTNTL
jgi:putative ABC transport system ATP-binding protein